MIDIGICTLRIFTASHFSKFHCAFLSWVKLRATANIYLVARETVWLWQVALLRSFYWKLTLLETWAFWKECSSPIQCTICTFHTMEWAITIIIRNRTMSVHCSRSKYTNLDTRQVWSFWQTLTRMKLKSFDSAVRI